MAASAPMAVQERRELTNPPPQGLLSAQGQHEPVQLSGITAEHTSSRESYPSDFPNYDASARKATYAKRLHHGEKHTNPPSSGVQSAEMPLRGAADPQRVNRNLPDENPMYAHWMGDRSQYTFNIDRGTFANHEYRKGSFHDRALSGRMPGSMMMGRAGSMFGMGAPPMSIYGMGSLYGGGFSRPVSVLGSMYGSQYGMGSMYGMGGPINVMGSFYSMGMPRGSMMYPMGLAGGSTRSMYSMNADSQFVPNGFGSAYGGEASQSNPGSIKQYDGSNYGMSGIGNSYEPQVGYGPTGVNDKGEAVQLNAVSHENASTGGPVGEQASRSKEVDPAPKSLQVSPGMKSSSGTHASTAEATSAAPGKSSDRKNDVAGLLVVSAGTSQEVPVVLPGNPPDGMSAEEVLRTGPEAQATALRVKRHKYCRDLYNSVNGGHNVALLIATDGTPESRSMAAVVATEVLAEALSEAAEAAARNGELGYYDAQVSACALPSATKLIDCVSSNDVKEVDVGSHPVFGPALLNVGAVTVRNTVSDMSQAGTAIVAACAKTDAHVVVVEAIVKQVRPAQRGDSQTDVLLSSILFLISNVTKEQEAFFDCLRNEAYVPPALVKGCIGGACRTVAVLCLPHCTDPSNAQEALASLHRIRNTANSMPRSGNLARFISFAAGENEKLRQRPGMDAAVLEKVDAMLLDGHNMLADPRNTLPVAYPRSLQRPPNSMNTPQLSSRDLNAHAAEKARDASNPVRVAVIATPQASNDVPPTFSIGPDGNSIVDNTTDTQASALEVVVRTRDDWRNVTLGQVSEVQTLFENGNNTAIIGATSPSELSTLSKHPLWLSYKRMVSSLLSVATQKYKSAEVSLSVTLLGGNEVLADLLVDMESEIPTVQAPRKLSVAYSPLFGPTVYKATIIKQPTPLQLESTINAALYHVPTIAQQHPGKKIVIVASAVMKGVTATDVYTSSMLAASAMDPTFFIDVLDKKLDVPHELFEYAFGGPCCTLFLAHVIQGDANVGKLVELMNRLNNTQNRSVRTCSVKKFIAFAEESLRRAADSAAAAGSSEEKETILRSKRSMEVFYLEYKTLIEDPEHNDPKTYRRSGGGTSSSSNDRVPSNKARKNANKGVEKGNERDKADADARSSGSHHSSGHRNAAKDSATRSHSRGKVDADARSSGSHHSSGRRNAAKDSATRSHSRGKSDANARNSRSHHRPGHRGSSAGGKG